jgi:hypothetical protein
MEGDPSSFRATVLDRRVDPTLDPELMSANLGLLWGLQDVLVPSPLLLPRTEALLAACGLDVGLTQGGPRVRAFLDRLPLASLLGVRYVLTTHVLDDPRLDLVQAAPVRVYRNREARPLASLVSCARPADGPEAALAALAALNPALEAVVEGPPDVLPASLRACAGDDPGEAVVLSHRDRAWRIRTDAAAPALLVVAASRYPGWHATVDGVPAPLLAADLSLGGVVVPAGIHEVALDYRPAWLRPAFALAAAALAVLLGSLLWPGGRRQGVGSSTVTTTSPPGATTV